MREVQYSSNPTIEDLAWIHDQRAARDKYKIPLETAKTIIEQHPHSYTVIREDDKLLGYITALPSTADQKQRFLDDELDEQALIQDIVKQKNRWETSIAIYLHSAFVTPIHRQEGKAVSAGLHALKNINPQKETILYSRPTSMSGLNALEKLSQLTRRQLYLKN